MPAAFADTFHWLATLNPNDSHHLLARARPADERKVTSQAVLMEVMDALCNPKYRRLAREFWVLVHRDPRVTVVALDDPLLDRAAAMFKTHADKEWSLTDCISYHIMKDRGLTVALTMDHHFRQMGFTTAY